MKKVQRFAVDSRRFLVAAIVFACLCLPAMAQKLPAKLKVGVFPRPPFALKDDKGRWTGLGVQLWEEIAKSLNLEYEYVETPLDDLFPKLVRGDLDLAVGELAVSAQRARLVNFTQPYFSAPAAVAIPRGTASPKWETYVEEIMQHGVAKVVLIMFATLLIFSFVLWLMERKVNKAHFGGHPIHGFGSALWFAAVTMTTVGYGDKTPQSPGGRLLAFVWMFFGILLVSAFTGTVASSLTVSRLNSGIQKPSDLVRYHNGVVEGSLAQEIMGGLGVSARRYLNVEEGLAGLQKKEITAFVGNTASLRYFAHKRFSRQFEIVALPTSVVSFAIALRPGLPQEHEINVALVEETTRAGWQDEVEHWMGPSPQK